MAQSIKKISRLVPLLTISGFLGSGKTTLVNRLLKNAVDQRIIVFVNDFGAINIDYDLVETVDSDRVSLKNGCVCCTLNDDLIKNISEFVKQKQPPDAILIEASGIADPRSLDSSLATLERAGLIRLDTKLYIIDADNFDSLSFDDAEEIIDHAAASDIVLINKADLAAKECLENLHDTISKCAPYTTLVETIHSDFPVNLILDFENLVVKNKLNKKTYSTKKPVLNHSDRYRSYSFETKKLVDRNSFQKFAKTLPSSCLRAKAILRFNDHPNEYHVFNLVGFRANLEIKRIANTTIQSQFVAIGLTEKINPAEIEKAFLSTLLPDG
ncbi:MAG: CobW family GTP-binding protein [Arenicella sp.]